jgi:DNA primase
VAQLFHTGIGRLENKSEAERALHDIVCNVKRNSYEYYSQRLGTDISALNQVIEGKKALEELNKMHISLD